MTKYRAKRAGWDEQLTPAQQFDLTPVSESFDSMDLEGEMTVIPYAGGELVLVGGEEADPKTIEEIK